jgi:hypothetical protein
MCVVIDHPLQPFSRCSFTQDIRFCSDDAHRCEAGRGHSFPFALVTSGLPEPEEPRTLYPYVGNPHFKVVQPMGVLPHRQQGLTNPRAPDAFRPMS